MKILIYDIENSKSKKIQVEFNEFIEEIETEAPIKATLTLDDLNQSIWVSGTIEADVILQCNRCLEEFVFETKIDVDEIYYKGTLFENPKKERELKNTDFAEDLQGSDSIDVTDLIYQSVILSVPNDCVCDINCKGESINLEKFIHNPEK